MLEFLVFCVLGLALPIILLGIAWRRYDRQMRTTIIVPTLSVVLLLLAIPHGFRWIILGPDYSHRLFSTIEVNIVLVFVRGTLLRDKEAMDRCSGFSHACSRLALGRSHKFRSLTVRTTVLKRGCTPPAMSVAVRSS